MLNSEQAYRECGRRAARALNEHDQGRYTHEARWKIIAVGMEQPEDRPAARAAYDAGFNETRNKPKPEYFK